MLEVYISLVRAGRRTLESVPMKYREEVRNALEANEQQDK